MLFSRRAALVSSGACGLGALLSAPGSAWADADVAARNAAVLAGLAEPGVPLRTWKWIVVHHTAAEFATLPGIDRYHRNHFGDPLGAEYHFIINNGKKDRANRPIGLIEPARWRYQEAAWHLFKPDNAPSSIAICLVGNFETRALPEPMLAALTGLTRALMKLCGIPVECVSTHRVVDEKMTQCPGKHFPREAFLQGLAAPDGAEQASRRSGAEQASRRSGAEQASRRSGADQASRRSGPEQASWRSGAEQASRPSGPDQASRPSGADQASRPSGPDQASRPSGPDQG